MSERNHDPIGSVAALAVFFRLHSPLRDRMVADALSGPGTLGTDDDPELVRDAAPSG